MNQDSLWLVTSILGRILRPYIHWGFGILSDYKKRSRMTTLSKNSSLEEVHEPQTAGVMYKKRKAVESEDMDASHCYVAATSDKRKQGI